MYWHLSNVLFVCLFVLLHFHCFYSHYTALENIYYYAILSTAIDQFLSFFRDSFSGSTGSCTTCAAWTARAEDHLIVLMTFWNFFSNFFTRSSWLANWRCLYEGGRSNIFLLIAVSILSSFSRCLCAPSNYIWSSQEWARVGGMILEIKFLEKQRNSFTFAFLLCIMEPL